MQFTHPFGGLAASQSLSDKLHICFFLSCTCPNTVAEVHSGLAIIKYDSVKPTPDTRTFRDVTC